MSRNLLVYSQKRALLINSASHIIYDVHLEGLTGVSTGNVAVEFFELKGHVYSVFAKGSKVIIYKGYEQQGVIEYSNREDIKPLQLIFERDT